MKFQTKKITVLILFFLSFGVKAQQIDLYGFQQFDVMFPNNRLGYGINFNFILKNSSKLRVGYSYQKIKNEYPASDFGWYLIVKPDQNLNDINFAYIFKKLNPSNKKFVVRYGIETSLLIVRGSIENSDSYLNHYSVPVNFTKIYLGNEVIFQYNSFILNNLSLIMNLSFGIVPTGTSLVDYGLLQYIFAPSFRLGIGFSYNFKKIINHSAGLAIN